MNREEAKNQFSNELLDIIFKGNNELKVGGTYKIIDDIYDDFESRTRGNCFCYRECICICRNSLLYGYVVEEDFGCNKFKRRENNV